MAFGKAVAAKPFQLPKDPFGKFFIIPFGDHAFHKLFFILTYLSLRFKGSHAPAQPIRFVGGKACRHNRYFHGLLLEQRYTKGPASMSSSSSDGYSTSSSPL